MMIDAGFCLYFWISNFFPERKKQGAPGRKGSHTYEADRTVQGRQGHRGVWSGKESSRDEAEEGFSSVREQGRPLHAPSQEHVSLRGKKKQQKVVCM